VIVPLTEKSMTEVPDAAFDAAIAARSDPAPESFRLETTNVVKVTPRTFAAASTAGTSNRH
jgi:hypothetical protein